MLSKVWLKTEQRIQIDMQSNFQLLLLLCIITVNMHGQEVQSPSLNIGDPAPPLRVRGWLKGEPIQRFEKGKVYIVEFWATWCKPCIAAMPHLSALAGEYKDRVIILGIDTHEKKTTSIENVKAFVDSMGHWLDIHVAVEDRNFMVTGWFDASGEEGIPKSFVVNTEGRLAWIGYPTGLDDVLPKIVNNTWDIKEALAKRNLNKHLEELDKIASDKLNMYVGDAYKQDFFGKPDSALLVINEIIRKEPKLKYSPMIAFHTFSALLKTNPNKAYDYGKAMLMTSTYEEPDCYSIIDAIKWYSDKIYIPTEIYELGAEAYLVRINQIPYPEIADISRLYYKMAEWYWCANNKLKAIDVQQKAIEALKSEKDFSKDVMTEFEFQLQQYKSR